MGIMSVYVLLYWNFVHQRKTKKKTVSLIVWHIGNTNEMWVTISIFVHTFIYISTRDGGIIRG